MSETVVRDGEIGAVAAAALTKGVSAFLFAATDDLAQAELPSDAPAGKWRWQKLGDSFLLATVAFEPQAEPPGSVFSVEDRTTDPASLIHALARLSPELHRGALNFLAGAGQGRRDATFDTTMASAKALLREPLDVSHGLRGEPRSVALDAVVACGAGAYYLRGWVRDSVAAFTGVTAVTPHGGLIELRTLADWEDRPLVDAYFGVGGSTTAATRGFSCIVEVPGLPSHGEWLVEMRSPAGAVESVPVLATENVPAARELVLRNLVGDRAPTAVIATAVGALERIQQQVREAIVESTHAFGRGPATCTVSLLVAATDDATLVEHHLAAYADDSDLRGVEVVFVVTGADGEQLVAGAPALLELYGLPFRIVVLDACSEASLAAAVNAAVRSTCGRLLALTRGGVIPASRGWLGRLVEAYETYPNVAAVGGTVLTTEGVVFHSGIDIDVVAGAAVRDLHDNGIARRTLFPAPYSVDAADGCVLVSAEALARIHGLDGACLDSRSELLMLCLRLRAAGGGVFCAPAAEFYDAGTGSPSHRPAEAVARYDSLVLAKVVAEPEGESAWVDEILVERRSGRLSAGLRPPSEAESVDGHGLTVTGHALAADTQLTSVIVSADGIELGRAALDRPTPKLAEAHPENPDAKSCGFLAQVNLLGQPEQFELTVAAETESGEQLPVGTIRGGRRLLRTGVTPALRPLFVTTLGRTGSSWLMLLLAQHPAVVAYLPFKFEPRVASYWLAVTRALSQPRSYLQSIAPELNAGHWWLGDARPSAAAAVKGERRMSEWLGTSNVEAVARFAQGQIDGFYSEVAASMDREHAVFFAEKRFPVALNDRLAAELYPDAAEIFLIRDLRDVACSALSVSARRNAPSFGRELASSDAEYLQVLRTYALEFRDGWRARRDSSILVRYEDLIQTPESELARIFAALGVDADEMTVATVEAAARSAETRGQESHRTAESPTASIGRWRRDLDEELQRIADETLGDILGEFGYATSTPATGDDPRRRVGGRRRPARSTATEAIPEAVVSTEAGPLVCESVELFVGPGSVIATLAPGLEAALADSGHPVLPLGCKWAGSVAAAVADASEAGATHLFIPGSLLPWVETQTELYEYLAANARELSWREEAAAVYHLIAPSEEVSELQRLPVSRRVSPNDLMYTSGADGYYNFGRSALQCIRRALELTGQGPPESVLDLPSGHGRVLRFIRTYWPEAELVACDLDRNAVDFCADTFAAARVYSEARAEDIPLDRRFDVVWVGSLLTHIDVEGWDTFLPFLVDRLEPGAVLLFTFHGDTIVKRMRTGEANYWIADPDRLLSDWEEHGFAYQDYLNQKGYGISLSSTAWVCDRIARLPGARVLGVWPGAWFSAHDVAVVSRD
jgi:SAM-dependent methyltransferase